MMKLVCRNCGNDEHFIASYLYRCLVDNQGDKLEEEIMDDEPVYECEKCGSHDVEITFVKN